MCFFSWALELSSLVYAENQKCWRIYISQGQPLMTDGFEDIKDPATPVWETLGLQLILSASALLSD